MVVCIGPKLYLSLNKDIGQVNVVYAMHTHLESMVLYRHIHARKLKAPWALYFWAWYYIYLVLSWAMYCWSTRIDVAREFRLSLS